tara:strand:+ start:875 stop:1387 length:513 start_codon:yes stop_codon:yes gene_type:complete
MAGKKITDLTDYPGGVFANTNEMEMSVDIGASVFVSRKVSWTDILASIPVNIQVACSDETTPLVVGSPSMTFRSPHAMTLTEVRASLTTAGTGATLVSITINVNAVNIFSGGGTGLTIDATEKTSTTATTPNVIGISAVPDDAEITIDIDSVDSGNVATGLKVTLIGYKS